MFECDFYAFFSGICAFSYVGLNDMLNACDWVCWKFRYISFYRYIYINKQKRNLLVH